MIVCIAEKPSVARDIATVLGATRRVGTSGCGYMEGNGYRVTWTFGHLCTLKEPEDYSPHWRRWSLGHLPIIPDRFGIKAIESEHYLKQLSIISELLQDAEMVVNCGDAGQEGELIQRWVLQKCGNKAPVKRLWISSLTNEAIRDGFESLKDESQYQSLYEAGLARAIGDWLLGINATRLYTTRFAQRGQVLSIGRVQTPTLALIVQRQKEIDSFRPEPYWELHTIYRGVSFASSKGKLKKQKTAEELLETVLGKDITITSVNKKVGKEAPPKLFDLTSLQVACNKKFGLSAEETLATIQSLYERKLTTYPRVDTTYLSDDIYPKCSDILTQLVGYRHLTTPLLAERTLRKSKKVFDNSKITDHHAIIPTGQPVHGLSDREQKVFDLIAKHFIAIFYPDCQFSSTIVQADCQGIGFKTSGKEIISPGWRAVFAQTEQESSSGVEAKEEEDNSDEQERQLPSFVSGESGPHTPEIKTKQTQPPKYYTEATLLRAMESAGKAVENEELREAMKENGIGRPSTRANIIETLFKRKYIERAKRKNIQATPQGIQLIETIKNELLKSAELTGQWEYKLRRIERKELEAGTFISELKQLAQDLVDEVIRGGSAPSSREVTDDPPSTPTPPIPHSELVIPEDAPLCPICQEGRIIRGRTSYGCSAYRSGCGYRISFEDFEASKQSELGQESSPSLF